MRIHAISTSETKGVRKVNAVTAVLAPGHGIISDAHAGDWHRQVSLLAVESIYRMVDQGIKVGPGDFAENITTEGINLAELSIGDRLRLGSDVQIEITQKGKECHDRCAIYYEAGDCIMPREGIFARVLDGGTINVGDPITRLGDNRADDNQGRRSNPE